ncbi:glycosyltransferase family 2 protein [Flavonifractor sp. An52]|uniref:glycosyltransferase family 2 protein n=1 Tax=Flavonifractor sp. An52 TaxID=1965642 RepID=UPI00130267FA|nr:glycosyltransferase family 2 protein [Flavonifractor sp. An52]
MLLSVIIPVYNCKEFVCAAIDSILKHQLNDLQIICVDDGSTDGSDLLLDSIAQKNEGIHVIHQRNSGVSVARNTGIDYVITHSQSKYIAFLDADDAWCMGNIFTPELLEVLYADASPDIYAFSSYVSNQSMSAYAIYGEYENAEYHDIYAQPTPNNGTLKGHFAALLYKTNMLAKENIRFCCGAKFSEDTAFAYHALCASSYTITTHTFLYIYRRNPFSATHNNFDYKKYFTYPLIAWETMLTELREKNNDHWLKAISGCEENIAWMYLEAAGHLCECGMTQCELEKFLNDPKYIVYFKKEGTWAKNTFDDINRNCAGFVRKHRKNRFKTYLINKLRKFYPAVWLYEKLHYTIKHN